MEEEDIMVNDDFKASKSAFTLTEYQEFAKRWIAACERIKEYAERADAKHRIRTSKGSSGATIY